MLPPLWMPWKMFIVFVSVNYVGIGSTRQLENKQIWYIDGDSLRVHSFTDAPTTTAAVK